MILFAQLVLSEGKRRFPKHYLLGKEVMLLLLYLLLLAKHSRQETHIC